MVFNSLRRLRTGMFEAMVHDLCMSLHEFEDRAERSPAPVLDGRTFKPVLGLTFGTYGPV